MYSIVMVAAMTAAPETPDFFKKGGGCYGGCQGMAAGGCYGNGGCFGGGHKMFGGHGFGGGCNGCFGGGHKMFGWPWVPGPQVTAAAAAAATRPRRTRVVAAMPFRVTPLRAMPFRQARPVVVGAGVNYSTLPATGIPEAVSTLPANRGQVVVRVPVDAKLFADGQATLLTGTERVFLTPDLSAGRDFQYTLKVEYTANGETKSDSKQVVVRAGHRTVIDFATPTAEKATSSVTVTLPEKAKLFVDGVAAAATAGKHTFSTPELAKGKSFVYEFRAELEKDGKTETVEPEGDVQRRRTDRR